jgi:hypothetical protein
VCIAGGGNRSCRRRDDFELRFAGVELVAQTLLDRVEAMRKGAAVDTEFAGGRGCVVVGPKYARSVWRNAAPPSFRLSSGDRYSPTKDRPRSGSCTNGMRVATSANRASRCRRAARLVKRSVPAMSPGPRHWSPQSRAARACPARQATGPVPGWAPACHGPGQSVS